MCSVCFGCGGTFDDVDVLTHPYVPASSGCWATFGSVQATELYLFGYPDVHGWVVDTYMASHVVDFDDVRFDVRNNRSVSLHLLGLHARIVLRFSSATVRRLVFNPRNCPQVFPVVKVPARRSDLDVGFLVGCDSLSEYERRARLWAFEVYDSYADVVDELVSLWHLPAD